jgi:RNA polymerase sigma factor (sigma-70 family)
MTQLLSSLLHHLRRQSIQHEPASDADLLDRFARLGDERAFAALVARHGPMVHNACRRILRDADEAQDAFQATFLILVRKSGAIRSPDALAGYLYGVACRVALKARSGVRRHERLADVAEPIDPRRDPLAEVSARDLLAALEQEVQRLPLGHRLPVVLCCLDGLSQEEAAERLGCTPDAVRGRLERGRKRLHERLGRRGLTLSAVLGAAEVARVAGGVPATLLISTASQAAGSASSAQAAALAEGVLKAMFLHKLKIAVGVLLTTAVAGLAAGVLTRQVKSPVTTAAVAEKPKTDKDHLQGTWIPVSVEEAGKKVPEEKVKAKNFEMVIKGDKMTLPHKDGEKEVSYKLNPGKDPKQIDLLLEKEKTAKGIYSLKGDTLRLCVGKDHDSERPTKFTTAGTNCVLLVLKKKK